ncbi:MAG TPA: aminoglycoside phosphotransferase family protein [Steroidobacteraceae bacterium]|nr:aminoglycoside phosphotransferase family protein [Steroidobacteraceae bacterium]
MAKPTADITTSIQLVLQLIRAQHPVYAELPVSDGDSGWDNDIYRLGGALAVRLPRREAAVALLQKEQRWLPQLQPRLPLPIPAPAAIGEPQEPYPWPWSITPWFAGQTLDHSRIGSDQVEVLAGFLAALHTPAPSDAPQNPWRTVPLAQLQPSFDRCRQALAGGEHEVDAASLRLWEEAARTPLDVKPTWIHGDLHPRNVLVKAERLFAVIDWGDMGAGDRAVDLAVCWMLLPQAQQREELMRRCAGVSLPTWCRARGWALLFGLHVLSAADPQHRQTGLLTIQRLREGP